MRLQNIARTGLRSSKAVPLLLAFLACSSCSSRRGTQPQFGTSTPAPAGPNSSSPLAAQAQSTRTLLIEVEGLGLFRDESLEAARLVADFALKRGLKVVDPEFAYRVFELARVGKDPARAESCGRPLAEFFAESRYQTLLGASGKLKAFVECDEACSLRIWAFDELGFSGDQMAFFSSSYDFHLPWREALRQALANTPMTSRPDDDANGGLGFVGGTWEKTVVAHPEDLHWTLQQACGWDRIRDPSEPSNLQVSGDKKALRPCFGDQGNSAELIMAIDPHGKVTRCESRNADTPSSVCACNAWLTQGRASEQLWGKRVYVAVNFSPADIVTPARAIVGAHVNTHLVNYRDRRGESLWRTRVSDPSIEAWDPPEDFAIARCFARNEDSRNLQFSAKVQFDAQGKAIRSQVVEASPRPLSESEAACVERAFHDSTAPCPAVETSSAEARVEVTFQKIGSKRR